MALGGFFHGLQFGFEAQLVILVLELQPASKLNRGGNPLEGSGQLLDSFVLRVIKDGLKMARLVCVGQRLFAGIGDGMRFVFKITVEVIRLLGQLEVLRWFAADMVKSSV